jgi:glycosyltransferase involved in cell wall biosynthesis
MNTLNSIQQTVVNKNDIEIIIVDDASSDDHIIEAISDSYSDLDIKVFSFKPEEKWWSCPVIPINKGIAMATGDVVVLLCAECMFVGDILLDINNRIKLNDYLVYATLSLTESDTTELCNKSYDDIILNKLPAKDEPGHSGGWYQHSEYRNACFNFCTAIMREDLLDLGGFDERFGWGASHGDDNFLDRIKIKGMNIISIDDPMTYHQWHPAMLTHPETKNLVDGELLKVTRTETGYKIINSFI